MDRKEFDAKVAEAKREADANFAEMVKRVGMESDVELEPQALAALVRLNRAAEDLAERLPVGAVISFLNLIEKRFKEDAFMFEIRRMVLKKVEEDYAAEEASAGVTH